jgi:hypothetical protein
VWLEEDTRDALEWIEYEQSLCTGCGQPRSESFDPNGPEYDADYYRCRACEAMYDAQRSDQNDRTFDPAGAHYVLERVSDDEQAARHVQRRRVLAEQHRERPKPRGEALDDD